MNLFNIYNAILDFLKGDIYKSDFIDEYTMDNIFCWPQNQGFVTESLFRGNDYCYAAFIPKRLNDKVTADMAQTISERYSHAVSLYLLGVYIARTIGYEKFKLPKYDNNAERTFLQHWSACCLFHDMGYSIEMQSPIYDRYTNISDLLSHFKCKFNLLEDENISADFADLIQNYFRYRKERMGRIDHGIVSGLLFFDSMKKEQQKKIEMASAAEIFIDTSPLSNSQLNSIAFFYSETLIKHNIWFIESNSEKVSEYKKYGLDSLIISKTDTDKKISFRNNPLLFLLCFLDTIEPLKRAGNYSGDKLRDYDFSIIVQENVFKIVICGSNLDNFFNYLLRQQYWLDFTPKYNKSKITISCSM